MSSMAPAFAGWSLAVTMAAVCCALLVRGGRRRAALNQALHELRRPLQAIALVEPAPPARRASLESSLDMAGAALERLDREVNGVMLPPATATVRCEAVLRSVVGRWRPRVALAGGRLELRWRAADASVSGDRSALEQAVDNLVVNAIEHGGPEIVVEGTLARGRLRLAVMDSGRAASPESASCPAHGARPREALTRLAGGRRHGHGLAVVREAAREHGGRFALRVGERGSIAVLELPLAAGPPGAA